MDAQTIESSPSKIQRPAFNLHLSEVSRAWKTRAKALKMLEKATILKTDTPRVILVIPGFMASPWSTTLLRSTLEKAGHRVYDWQQGRNLGRVQDIDSLSRLISSISQKHNSKVSLIGWSLGGIYARRLAQVHTKDIDLVVTLASPYKDIYAPNYARWLFDLFQAVRQKKTPQWVMDLPKPLVVIKTVAYYTRQDGIVPWEACADFEDPTDHENIEVTTGHLGMGMDFHVIMHLVNLLD